MSKNIGEAYEPEDAASLRRATATVIKEVAGNHSASEKVANEAAKAVLAVARSGYARDPEHSINADDLAEAAVARVHSGER